ncbi:MAG: radical SAM protein [Clostridia bacterium]|nr:radical SAM protein [Clostridia bacterium]
MSEHRNVGLFIVHAGCPHRCVFCDQKAISGEKYPVTPDDVRAAAETALSSGEKGGEIAFFGGSFTAVPRKYMISLLEAALPYVRSGDFSGVRCSTRPDCIDPEILDILEKYRVSAVELGAQSMSDETLAANLRGHTSDDVRRASRLIKERGMQLGLQMMTGMYRGGRDIDVYTAEEFVKLAPDTVRIYPTVTIKNTALADKYESGEYVPPTLEETVELCARLITLFRANGIKVIRCGLHSGGGVEEGYVAGPYHPAFGELCESRILLEKVLPAVRSVIEKDPAAKIEIRVAPREVSRAVGQKRSNIEYLGSIGARCRVIPDASVAPGEPEVKAV